MASANIAAIADAADIRVIRQLPRLLYASAYATFMLRRYTRVTSR